MKATANSLACILIIAILVSFPAGWAFPPGAGRTLEAGHEYVLQLQGIKTSVGGEDYTPENKEMTVRLGRTDLGNLMMEFYWTHDPGPQGNPDNYILILGFDFDNDGIWEDTDNPTLGSWGVYTPDDALGLVTLGWNIDICLGKDCDWMNIYIPHGHYVFSWGVDPNKVNDGFQWVAIGGPPGPQSGPHGSEYKGIPGPGPQYPGSTPTNLNPIELTPYATGHDGTSYAMKVGVPLTLFHGIPSGFGFGLGQQATVCPASGCEQVGLSWVWPTEVQSLAQGELGTSIDPSGRDCSTDPGDSNYYDDCYRVGTGAQYLGNLDPYAEGSLNYQLQDPPQYGEEAVGGYAIAADKITLLAPWIALLSIVAAGLVIAVTMARRRKA